MSDLFYEIQNEIKQERVLSFFKKYIVYFIILGTLLVLSCIIYPIYIKHKNTVQAELINNYYLVLEQKNNTSPEQFLSSLKQIYNKNICAISQIAGFTIAKEYYKMQNNSEGKKILKSISQNKCNPILSRFAEYLAVNYSINSNSDNLEFLTKLEKFSKEKKIINYRAILLRAAILIKNKSYNEAENILANILQSDFIAENIKKDTKILLDNITYYKMMAN